MAVIRCFCRWERVSAILANNLLGDNDRFSYGAESLVQPQAAGVWQQAQEQASDRAASAWMRVAEDGWSDWLAVEGGEMSEPEGGKVPWCAPGNGVVCGSEPATSWNSAGCEDANRCASPYSPEKRLRQVSWNGSRRLCRVFCWSAELRVVLKVIP